MFGLAMLVLIGVTVARMTGFEPLNAPVGGDVTAARSIVFDVREDGGLDVRDGTNGALILEFPDTTAGFMLGAHRAYMFERKRTGGVVDMEAPVEVVRWADGRMSLIDPETGWRAELHNFGVTSQANFARVLEAQG
jgi:putative photosynthetic complex assembly protein